MRTTRRGLLVLLAAVGILGTIASPARAGVPSQQADATWMVDERTWVVASAGGKVWVGGVFDRYLSPKRAAGPAAKGLAAFDASGSPASVKLPNLGSSPSVFDLSLRPNGTLYVAGKFSYSFEGKSRQNLVGINPSTGAIVAGFSTPGLKTVLATSSRIFAGGRKLEAYRLDGSKDGSFKAVIPKIDPSLRGHKTPSQFRDLVSYQGDVIAIGQFDFINGAPQKVAVKLDAQTGQPRSWKLANISQDSQAFGLAGAIAGDRLLIGAGGSDFAGGYRASDGGQVWKTDTSGSTQVITQFDSSTVIIGGHFQWVAQSGGQQCGSNQHPNKNCFNQPRLAALDAANGRVATSWKPQICCKYTGVWGLAVRRGALHVAGAFTKAGGRAQYHYARFS
jgi:hypothetical protein